MATQDAATQESPAATIQQGIRILEGLLPKGTTTEQAQSIIGSGILGDLMEMDWSRFDRNLFCSNVGITAFEVSKPVELSLDRQRPLTEYWGAYIDAIKEEVKGWLDDITFPDASQGLVSGQYVVIKCQRDMTEQWFGKFMREAGYLHVDHIEFLAFLKQGFKVADRYHCLWAPGKRLEHRSRGDFVLSCSKRAIHPAEGFIQLFNPTSLKRNFEACKGTCIVVRCGQE